MCKVLKKIMYIYLTTKTGKSSCKVFCLIDPLISCQGKESSLSLTVHLPPPIFLQPYSLAEKLNRKNWNFLGLATYSAFHKGRQILLLSLGCKGSLLVEAMACLFS